MLEFESEQLYREELNPPSSPNGQTKLIIILWFAASIILIGLIVYPIRTSAIRAGIFFSFVLVVAGSILFSWRKTWVRNALLGVFGVSGIWVMFPGQSFDREALRNGYIRALSDYKGTRYIWGGEKTRGIDCSGLIRCGLMDACLHEGMRGLNPGLVRKSFYLWWNDASALELKDGYRGETAIIGEANGINDADYTQLKAGDFAVTVDGVHTLAYLGNKVWMEADPGEGKVVEVTAPGSNPWFRRRVKLVRWKLLSA